MNTVTSPQLKNAHFDVCMVGAGIAGLSAAQALNAKGLNIAVLEKSRGPGGRMATRRIDGAQFNHGAPSFTIESGAFLAWVQASERNNALKIALNRASSGINSDIFTATSSSMNGLARNVFTPNNFYTLIRVTAITQLGKKQWQVVYDQESPQGEVLDTGHLTANKIVLALPAPQAAALLAPLQNTIASVAAAISYDPCWVAMVILPSASGISCDALGAATSNANGLTKCIRQAAAGDATTEGWVLHASTEWTKAHLNDTKEVAADALFAAFSKHFTVLQKPLFSAAHRWLYSQPAAIATSKAAHDEAADAAAKQGLFCVGDWVYSDLATRTMCNVERAWVSGQRLSV